MLGTHFEETTKPRRRHVDGARYPAETGIAVRCSAGLAVLGVLAAASTELGDAETVGGVPTVLLGDVVALLALRAGQSDLGANVGGLTGHVCLLVSILEHATERCTRKLA